MASWKRGRVSRLDEKRFFSTSRSAPGAAPRLKSLASSLLEDGLKMRFRKTGARPHRQSLDPRRISSFALTIRPVLPTRKCRPRYSRRSRLISSPVRTPALIPPVSALPRSQCLEWFFSSAPWSSIPSARNRIDVVRSWLPLPALISRNPARLRRHPWCPGNSSAPALAPRRLRRMLHQNSDNHSPDHGSSTKRLAPAVSRRMEPADR